MTVSFEHINPRLQDEYGIHLDAKAFMDGSVRRSWAMAMDAQPALVTTASSGFPAMFTTFVDPEVVRILQAPNKGADILGEKRFGTWTTRTWMVPVVENTGEVATYSDFSTNAKSDANADFVYRQSYLFETNIEYGDLEVDTAGEAKLNWIGEKQTSAAKSLMKFADYINHFGVSGLTNYGLLTDPYLSAALTPSVKAAGGNKWVTNGAVTATANEVYGDIQALFYQLVAQSQGLVEMTDAMTLVVPPQAAVGLTATNSFGIAVEDLIKKSFPSITVKTSPRYATASGNMVQLIANQFDGNTTGFCGFNEKLRDHRLVPATSSFSQKKTSGSWGAIFKYPAAVAQMLGV